MRDLDKSIDYAERLIKGIRRMIEKEHEEIRKEEGMEECTMGTWLDANSLCIIVEEELLPRLKKINQ